MPDLLNPAMPFLSVAVAAGLVLSRLLRRLVLNRNPNRNRPELQPTSRVARHPLRLTLCLIGVRTAPGPARRRPPASAHHC